MSVPVRRRREEAGSEEKETLLVYLAGNPNVGKTSLFNALTGAAEETAHCSGVTSAACAGSARWSDRRVEVVDLPGLYSLDSGEGEDQRLARVTLLERRPDVVIAVADATNLARSLYLPLQLIDFGYRVVVAVNLSDEARRRRRPIAVVKLAAEIGIPVVATSAPRGEGVLELEAAALAAAQGDGQTAAGTPLAAEVETRVEALASSLNGRLPADSVFAASPRGAALAILAGDAQLVKATGVQGDIELTLDDDPLSMKIAQSRHAEARRLAETAQAAIPHTSDVLWRLATTPRTGIPIMIGMIAAMFAALFIIGDLLARALTYLWTAYVSPVVTGATAALLGDGVLGRVVLWGIDGGILATLAVGIPYILTFYFILALIEDSGYMNAAAFLSDRVMHRVGLHGRAVIPLIAAGGCNVPAVIATRSLSSSRERLIAATLATLVPCSARSAVIVGAVAAVAGWQYALLTYAIVFAVLIVAGLAMNRFLPGSKGAFVMEMFPFRRPVLTQVMHKTWRRFREFVWDAAPIIVLGSMALGLLYETGIIWRFTGILEPVVEDWLLLPAVAGLTLLFAVLRKELALQLLLVFATVSVGGAVTGIDSFMTTSQIVTYATVNAIYIPCLATIAVLGREIGWRRTLLVCAGTIAVALLVGGLLAQTMALLGG